MAVDGATEAGLWLKDRLYLGYHEKAALIEVISYNEAAGRFEFQIVKDYRPGGKPEAFYASRAVCTGCHQNGGPIFSRASWAETNANPGVAARLREHAARFYGFPAEQSIDVAAGFDRSTDRANLFATTQMLWRDGCKSNARAATAVRCRAGALVAVLQYLLSSRRGFDTESARYKRDFFPALATWKERWPNGIAIPSADLPNRNPFAELGESSEYLTAAGGFGGSAKPPRAELLLLADVKSPFDPLWPRAPAEKWPTGEGLETTVERFIDGLAEFIAPQDIRLLDRHLLSIGASSAKRRTFRAACAFTKEKRGGLEALKFRCGEDTEANLVLRGRLYRGKDSSLEGTVEELALAGSGKLRNLQARAGDGPGPKAVALQVTEQDPTRRARLPNGNAIEEIRLSTPGSSFAGGELTGEASVTVVEDFALVTEAVDALARAAERNESDALSDKPFRRAALMGALFEKLNLKARQWCCLDDRGMPAPQAEKPLLHERTRPPPGTAGALAIFYRECGMCHGLSTPQPANFLHGGLSDVRAKIDGCAERIYYRLDMWRLGPEERPKTPMPPAGDWRNLTLAGQTGLSAADVETMKAYAAGVLRAAGRKPYGEVLRRDYATLRPCPAKAIQ